MMKCLSPPFCPTPTSNVPAALSVEVLKWWMCGRAEISQSTFLVHGADLAIPEGSEVSAMS